MKETQFRILVVDDSKDQIELLTDILSEKHKVISAQNGMDALVAARTAPQPDLILLDIRMPGIDGLEVCRILNKDRNTEKIPVILITGMDSQDGEFSGLDAGAVDYIHKPLIPDLIRARVKNHLALQERRNALESTVKNRTKELKLTQALLIDSMGILAEYRDPETGAHIKRTQSYVNALAKSLKKESGSGVVLSNEDIELLHLSAPLHDIGKVGVPDRILNKPEKLTDDEFEIMKEHTSLGYRMMQKTMEKMPNKSFLRYAEEIAYSHHEKWDGSGYPRGLKGEGIPLSGRLMALADVYDALVNKRCYKEAFTHERACEIIYRQSGKHFDPRIVEAFMKIGRIFQNILSAYRDFDEDIDYRTGVEDRKIRRLLIVDDNEINLEIMRNQLESLNYAVEMAGNGREAMDIYHTGGIDAVLTDLDMPEMNGYELSRKINSESPHIPVVAITASDYKINMDNMKEYGFSGYLLKPFDDNMIMTILNSFNNGLDKTSF